MSENNYVEISIFGRVSDPSVIAELAYAAGRAYDSGTRSLRGSDYDEKFGDVLATADNEGRAVEIAISNDWQAFEDLAGQCMEAGLSFVAYGEGGDDWIGGYYYHPGMDNMVEFARQGKKPLIAPEELEKATAQGIDAVNALLADLKANTTIGRIELDPGFIEAYVAYKSEKGYQP